MIKIKCYKKPIYILEGLNLLSILVNDQAINNNRNNVLNMELADKIEADLDDIRHKVDIQYPELFKYFNHTKASLATCLLNSFTDIFALEKDEFLELLYAKIESFKSKKIESITINQHLDVDDSSEKNDSLNELLNLRIDDGDKIRLLKAINDPQAYVEKILKEIRNIISYIEAIYAKYQADLNLDYFDEENTARLLKEVNCDIAGSIDIIPSVVHYNSLMLNINDKGSSKISIHCGLAIDVDKLNDVHFFNDDMEARLENFIKVINDKSKLKIIELLKEHEMYGAQLAHALNLKTPTISYHIDALMNAGIVSARRDNNRIHYTYNKENCLQIIEYLKHKLS